MGSRNGSISSSLPPAWTYPLLVVFAALAMHIDTRWYWSDNSGYVLLAKAIVTGKGYVNIYWPGSPPHSHFPPGLPLLLAPVVAIFGVKAVPVDIYMKLFGIGAAVLAYTMFIRRGLSKREALAMFLVFGTSPMYWSMSGMPVSDIVFVLTSMAAVYFTDKAARDERAANANLWLAVALMIVSFYVRTAGMAVIAGCTAFLLIGGRGAVSKRFVSASISGVLCLAAVLPWFIYTSRIAKDTYFQLLRMNESGGLVSWGEVAARSVARFVFYCATFVEWNLHGSSLLRTKIPIVFWAFAAPVVALTFIGVIRAAVRRESSGEYFLLFYMPLILPWYWYFDRFIGPIMIFLLVDLYLTVKPIAWDRLGERGRIKLSKALTAAVALMVVLNLAGSVRYLKMRFTPSPPWYDLMDSSKFIKDNTPADAVVFTRLSVNVYLNTGRIGDEFDLRNDPDKIVEIMKRYPHAYLLTQGIDEQFESKYTAPLLIKYPELFEKLYTAPGGTQVLYKFHPPAY